MRECRSYSASRFAMSLSRDSRIQQKSFARHYLVLIQRLSTPAPDNPRINLRDKLNVGNSEVIYEIYQ